MKKELFTRYINNQCFDSEMDEVFQWIKAEASDDQSQQWGREVWTDEQGRVTYSDEDFIALFDKIQKRIDQNAPTIIPERRSMPGSYRLLNLFSRVAAVLLIPVLVFLFYTISEKRIDDAKYSGLVKDSLEVSAPVGSTIVVQLSDGSEVTLNSGSKLKYPHLFSGKNREVKLRGEGFFKVAHNPRQPFVVVAGDLHVKAVGTIFNVLAYPDDDEVETTLVSGKVILEQALGNDVKSLFTMDPNQHICYNRKTTTIEKNEGNIEKYISWIEGKLIFEDTPILLVTERLGRMFNVDFDVKDEIKDYIYTVTFTDDSLYQILDLMTIATPITYKILPRKKLPNGTFSKQKIILGKR